MSCDLAVDVNGNPHLLTTICNGNNGYSVVYSQAHRMFDITLQSGFWVAYDVSNVICRKGTRTSPNQITQIWPRSSRDRRTEPNCFSWTDNTAYSLVGNQTPNLFGRGLMLPAVTGPLWKILPDVCYHFGFYHCSVWRQALGAIKYRLQSARCLRSFNQQPWPALVCNFNFLDNVTYSVSGVYHCAAGLQLSV